MAARTTAARTRTRTRPAAETEVEETESPKPVRRRRAAVKPAESVEDNDQDDQDEEPAPKPVRRRRVTKAEAETDESGDEGPAPKPVRRKAAPAKSAAPAKRPTKPVVEEEPDDGLTPNQRKMAALRAKRKPKGAGAAAKPAAPKRPPIQFSTKWLAGHVTEKIGREIDSFALRAVLRKLAKDGTLDREVGVERNRYEFGGPNDPVVKAVIAAYKDGSVDADKKAKLDALKSKRAAAPTSTKRKKPVPVVEEEYDDEDEVDELEDDDDEE